MSDKHKESVQFFDELRKSSYNKTISLIPKGHIYFHWGDFDLTCRYQQMLLTHDPFAIHKWQSLDMAMQFLKAFLIWVKNGEEVIETNLYDLYVWDLFDKDKMKLVLNDKSLVSSTGFRGEFVPFDQTAWHNPLLHQQFIYEKILSDEVDLRKFRLKLNAPIFMLLPKQNTNFILRCEQITARGLLFSLADKTVYEKILNEDKVVMYLSTDPVKQLMDLSVPDMQNRDLFNKKDLLGPLFSRDAKDSYHVRVKDMNFNQNYLLQTHHVMIPYESFVSEYQMEKLESLIPTFLRKVESEIREQVESHSHLYISKKTA